MQNSTTPTVYVKAAEISAPATRTYIDLFAGCGGLSLGLQQAGWEGIFAVERSPMAFETLKHNLVDPVGNHFPHWPEWLPKEACSIQKMTKIHREKLEALRGQVMLIAGGPPCQGFSYAGKRQKHDHRNQLYKSYVEMVRIVRPALVLLENVTGITRHFGPHKPGRRGRPPVPYSKRIRRALEGLGYKIHETEVLASDFGVPQSRVRFVAVGIDTTQFDRCSLTSPFAILGQSREQFLKAKGLPTESSVSCRMALSDLEFNANQLADCADSPGYKAGKFGAASTAYQRLMRGATASGAVADSHRFVKHRPEIVARFERILSECPRGKNLPDEFRKANGLKKACIVPLDPARPASTLTTIPDDMIHYSQPRVLTVRECARIQSFPDWFAVRSKYTTGGQRRKTECPRYTQIGNAVPPLLAEALGTALAQWIAEARPRPVQAPSTPLPEIGHVAA